MVLAAHQREFDLILDLFDVERTAGVAAACQGGDDVLGQFLHRLMHAARCCGAAAFHGEKRLGDGNGDLAGIERGDRAVSADDLVGGRRFGSCVASGSPARAGRTRSG